MPVDCRSADVVPLRRRPLTYSFCAPRFRDRTIDDAVVNVPMAMEGRDRPCFEGLGREVASFAGDYIAHACPTPEPS